MIDAQLGSVVRATRISPGSSSASAGSVTIRTRASTVPEETPVPSTTSPTFAASSPSAETGTASGGPVQVVGSSRAW